MQALLPSRPQGKESKGMALRYTLHSDTFCTSISFLESQNSSWKYVVGQRKITVCKVYTMTNTIRDINLNVML